MPKKATEPEFVQLRILKSSHAVLEQMAKEDGRKLYTMADVAFCGEASRRADAKRRDARKPACGGKQTAGKP